jgi:MoaA/NifB/PqqE/SkfB family radical SAM enzyme
MNQNPVTENLKTYGAKQIVSFVDSDPDKHIAMLLDWADKFDTQKTATPVINAIRESMNDHDSNWYKLVHDIYTNIDEGMRKTFLQNFVASIVVKGGPRKKTAQQEHQCNVPWAILMDPTSACNLKCTGCWAAEYGNKMSMSYEPLAEIIQQGKKLGTYAYLYSGGEPLMRKEDIIRLCKKHKDCLFLAFTNGTLIDEKFADDMLEVKNFVPAISVEGFEEATDDRRGKGTYKRVIKAMEILRERKAMFGISCCYTRKNAEIIGSEEYFDDMISKGAKFGWFFTYIPLGVNASPELIATAEQREYMYHQLRKFRKTKPFFTIDFWNDGEPVEGCIAGAKSYLHINANGDIEPCAFIHYSDSSIYTSTLLEAYKSPLFMQYHKNQPFNNNHLRPCPLLDNPEKLESMVIESGARSTEVLHTEDVQDLCRKCHKASENWAGPAAKLWKESGHGETNGNKNNEKECPVLNED